RRQLERQGRRRQAGVQAGIGVPLRHGPHSIAQRAQARVDGGPVVSQGTDGGRAGDHHAAPFARHQTMPPLTEITWRVMYPAASESRKATVAATSSGVPTRPAGIIFRACSTTCGSSISVSISPGATQLTVMRRLASSSASALVAPMMPALAAL